MGPAPRGLGAHRPPRGRAGGGAGAGAHPGLEVLLEAVHVPAVRPALEVPREVAVLAPHPAAARAARGARERRPEAHTPGVWANPPHSLCWTQTGVFPEGENRGRGARAGAEIWENARSPGWKVSRGTPDAVHFAPPPEAGRTRPLFSPSGKHSSQSVFGVFCHSQKIWPPPVMSSRPLPLRRGRPGITAGNRGVAPPVPTGRRRGRALPPSRAATAGRRRGRRLAGSGVFWGCADAPRLAPGGH